MSSAAEAPRTLAPAAPRLAQEPWTLRLFARRRPGWATAGVLSVISVLIVLLARTRPGFDPYGWLVWGHQTLHLALDTNAAPSWKPLSYLFTVPYALAGHYELWLWMTTVVAVSLAGCVFAARIAYRLTPHSDENRWAALLAGAFAAVALLGIQDYSHYVLSSQSDPMIVSLCLAAIDCQLGGRRSWAFVLGCLAALGRPEVWPFLGVYGIWAWRKHPEMRWLLAGGLAAILLLWFGIPALTSRTPFVAASNALGSGRRLRGDKVFGTIGRFLDLHATSVEILALVSIALAALRRDLVTLALAGGAAAWVVVEIAFSLHGWPGLGRYMFPAAGVMIVIAAVGFGRLLTDGSLLSPAARWIGVAAAVAAAVSLVPFAVSSARTEHADLKAQHARTSEINRLAATVGALGGAARIDACGEPLTHLEYQTIVAYTLHVNVASVGFKYGQAIARGNPIVLLTPLPQGGWQVQALHQRTAACRTLPS